VHPLGRFVACIGLAFAAIVASSDAAAADCKFDTDETDKFTKERTLGTRRNSLESFWGDASKDKQKDVYVSAWDWNGKQTLRVDLLLTSYVNRMPPKYELRSVIVIPKGSRLMVMMADGSVVTLLSVKAINSDAKATHTSTGVSVDAGAYIHYELNEELIAALTSQGATKIRVEAADMNYDIEVHEKSLDDISNAIQCLQESL
jgi:hypothetical protein